MAKKFDMSKMKRGKSLNEVAEKIDNMSDKTKEMIAKVEESPDPKTIVETVKVIKNDEQLPEQSKNLLIKELQKRYVELFNMNNCPEDYESLKFEAKFLAGMTKYSFLLMAQRLSKIRDKQLYKQDGYDTFKSFIENELNISKRTVYEYIDIITFFGVRLTALDDEIEYTKLSPLIPILKAEKDDIPKEELKDQFLEEINNKSQKELRILARDLKMKYGILKKDDNHFKRIEQLMSSFSKNLPGKLTDQDKEKLKKFIDFINEVIEKDGETSHD